MAHIRRSGGIMADLHLRRWFAIKPFKLPDIGEGIAEVQVMEWFVKEGERVKEMDKLCLVESDKASVEITSRFNGVVKRLLVPAQEHAKVGQVIVEIDDEEPEASSAESTPEASPAEPITTKQVVKEPGSKPAEHKIAKPIHTVAQAMPSARALAKQLGVDLNQINGTGREGRITDHDVQHYSESVSGKGGKELDTSDHGPGKTTKLSQVGIAMVKSMNESLLVPQLTHSDEIECDKLVDLVRVLKPVVKEKFDLPTLTLTAFLIKAVSMGISEYPMINSRISKGLDSVTVLDNHNVSVAMDSPRGLVVPNIKNVEKLSILDIQKQLLILQEKAHSGRLSLADVKGGTVSLSNVGVIGGTYTKPVIFSGQSVIGAVGKIQRLPRYINSQSIHSTDVTLVPKRVFNVSWTADHRHIDGASVARFSNVFKAAIENPEVLLALYFRS